MNERAIGGAPPTVHLQLENANYGADVASFTPDGKYLVALIALSVGLV
jgi:hypothetical protein